MRAPLSVAVLAPVLLAACSSTTQHERATPAEEMVGALSEEEFKALHELSEGAVPELRGKDIRFAGTRGYLSLPAGKPPFPGVVVIHEWWGLNDHIRHWADRLAADGYAALAVDLYGGKVAENRDDAMTYMRAVEQNRADGTMLAAVDYLRTSQAVRAPRTGCVGWCFGGGMALHLALLARNLDAAVMYYGRPITDPEKLGTIQASLLGIFGTQDQGIPVSQVEEFESALAAAGVEHRILTYDAQHAFANPSSARYDTESAAAAWAQVRAFFRAHLMGE